MPSCGPQLCRHPSPMAAPHSHSTASITSPTTQAATLCNLLVVLGLRKPACIL